MGMGEEGEAMGRERLALWAYTATTASALGSPVARDYAAVIEELAFTTVAPGGFGDLSCVAKLADARIPRPELAPFAPLRTSLSMARMCS